MTKKIEKVDLGLRPFDAAEYLDNVETIAAYLTEALESNEPGEIAQAIGTVARARGMAEVAKAAGLSRESLYRALSSKGNPELSTLLGVMKACGLRLSAAKSGKSESPQRTRRKPQVKRRRRPALAA